ncbi:MAG: carotenoid 1,2-hydratase [Chlorobiaceae bacterium]|nr:carotenoid 1,2-hydratase [Chlorobiaceae bacterium]
MDITTDSAQEVWHRLDDPGSYEWWYFDAEDERQGISLVFIWFDGFPFSPFYMRHYDQWRSRRRGESPRPGHYAGFSFQMYENGREVVNFIREGQDAEFGCGPSGVGVRFGNNRFEYDGPTDMFLLSVDFEFPARGKRVKGSFTFRPRHRFDYRRRHNGVESGAHRHQWLLSVPKADVEGELVIDGHPTGGRSSIRFDGRGYHDHNLGTMPMHEYYGRWYWGRVFAGRYDLVYYVVFFRDPGITPLAVALVNDNETGRQHILDQLSFREEQMAKGVFAPFHGRELRFAAEGFSLEVSHRRVLDAGPFYLRFSSNYSLRLDGEDVDAAEGISEFLNPAALRSPVMRFFTSSRVLRDGETSAMYRYYNFFKHQFDWLNRKKL